MPEMTPLQAAAKAANYDMPTVDLIRRTVAKGADDDQLAQFLHNVARTGLNPLARQIYCVMRRNNRTGKLEMSVQTGIDGYRVVADRTGAYAGSSDPIFDEGLNQYAHLETERGHPKTASVTVTKIVAGQVFDFTATALWSSYYPGDRQGQMWNNMPYLMLGKCAEALALRKAFPQDLSGIYTHEEMQQAGGFTLSDEGEVTVDGNSSSAASDEAWRKEIDQKAEPGSFVAYCHAVIYKVSSREDPYLRCILETANGDNKGYNLWPNPQATFEDHCRRLSLDPAALNLDEAQGIEALVDVDAQNSRDGKYLNLTAVYPREVADSSPGDAQEAPQAEEAPAKGKGQEQPTPPVAGDSAPPHDDADVPPDADTDCPPPVNPDGSPHKPGEPAPEPEPEEQYETLNPQDWGKLLYHVRRVMGSPDWPATEKALEPHILDVLQKLGIKSKNLRTMPANVYKKWLPAYESKEPNQVWKEGLKFCESDAVSWATDPAAWAQTGDLGPPLDMDGK